MLNHEFYTNCKYNKTIAATDMIIKAEKPRILENLLLVKFPITFLLLDICKIIAIKTGAVIPYKMAV